jgi:hypothetical protein
MTRPFLTGEATTPGDDKEEDFTEALVGPVDRRDR